MNNDGNPSVEITRLKRLATQALEEGDIRNAICVTLEANDIKLRMLAEASKKLRNALERVKSLE